METLVLAVTFLGAVGGGGALIYAIPNTHAKARAFWVIVGCFLIALGIAGLIALIFGQEQAVKRDPWPTIALVALAGVILSGIVLRSLGLLAEARSWIHVERGPAGDYLRVRLPQRGGKRRLRREALALAAEIHAHLAKAPSSFGVPMAQHRAMMSAKDEAERAEIWEQQTQAMIADSDRQSRELAGLFGGRLRYLVGEFVRRGLLTAPEADKLIWEANSYHWIKEAATELEALALRL